MYPKNVQYTIAQNNKKKHIYRKFKMHGSKTKNNAPTVTISLSGAPTITLFDCVATLFNRMLTIIIKIKLQTGSMFIKLSFRYCFV